MSEEFKVSIVQANPGFLTVYADSGSRSLYLGEPVIAWAVSYQVEEGQVEATTQAISSIGEDSFVGVQQPDGKVTAWDSTFENIAHAQAFFADRLAKEEATRGRATGPGLD